MIKNIISKYGDYVLSIGAAVAVILLFKWFLSSGPLYDMILKFAG